MILTEWALDWGIPRDALADLVRRWAMDGTTVTHHPKRPEEGASESRVTSLVKLEAAQKGVLLFRNNVGVLMNEAGTPVRFGLANDSKVMNESIKSADLIGIRPLFITSAHIGLTIGQFVSREVKEGHWTYSGNGREPAQLRWCNLIASYGGDAGFATGVGTL